MAKVKEPEQKIQHALTLIADGESVRKSCKKARISKAWFLATVDSDQYARARDACADTHFDDLGELAEKVQAGDVEPNAARVAADIIKWRVARMKPRVYGDKLPVEDTQSDQKNGIITALKEIFNAD